MSIENAIEIASPLICDEEGFRSDAYLDTIGNRWTIGYGTTGICGEPVHEGQTCTREEATGWVRQFIVETARQVYEKVRVPLTDNQAAALISFAYNCGIGTFERSVVLAELNDGFPQEAAARLLDYDNAGNGMVPGLRTRRQREQDLFLTPADEPPPSPDNSADVLNEAELQSLKKEQSA